MSTASQANSIDIQTLLTRPVEPVERYLAAFIKQRSLPRNLRQAIEYALLGGGKRLRPILTVYSCEAVGGTIEQALAPAAAIEMIHAFSLVHDDLPAMDDDDLRRGRPTLHKATNEAMAILAGDAMMGLAFELLADRLEPPTLTARILGELTRATNDMIAGQVYDTLSDFDANLDDLSRLRLIHQHKTGALIRCSCRMGALVVGADETKIEALSQFGESIGLMFQVVDDLLDCTQSTQHLGKTAGKDAAQDKATYPGLLGLDRSRQEVERLHNQALAALASLGESARDLRDLTVYMATRTR